MLRLRHAVDERGQDGQARRMKMPRRPLLLKSERGAAVIELALAAPILAVLTIGMIDLSNAYSRKLALEQGAQRAVEKIMQTTEEDTVENTLVTEAVCQVNGTNADGTCKTTPINSTNVTVSWRRECTNGAGSMSQAPGSPYTASADFDLAANACPGGTVREANYIEVALTDKYTPMFPLHFAGYNGDGTYHMSATAGVRTQ
jgi:Flp pilus assembly protein TadG